MFLSHKKELTSPVTRHFGRFYKSVWLFPAILTILLVTLTVLKVSGSSIGVYHTTFYGDTKDSNLLLNKPRPIRSDEWLVNTQTTMAQKSANFSRINKNIGNGEDMSVLADAPYKDWSVLFKPHNLAFFLMPFDNAFAFRWWLMGYLLVISSYFFILALLPKKRLLAALLSTSFFFSPFIQWWYLYGTLGALYYSFFGAVILMKLIDEKRIFKSVLWGLLLAYVAVCFVLVLYPPFQIPCALAMMAFSLGYIMERFRGKHWAQIRGTLGIIAGSAIIAGIIVGLFLVTRSGVIHAIESTAYPGKRIELSGGYDPAHFLSGHLATQFQYISRAGHYFIPEKGITNQSEAANFILLMPFLLLPAGLLLVKGYKNNKKLDWPLVTTSLLFLMFLVRMFVPHFNWFFKLMLLQSVPNNRLVIGLGLLSFIYVILLIRNISALKKPPFSKHSILAYVILLFALEVWLGLYAKHRFPGFIGTYKAWLLAIPIPVIVYLLLTKRNVLPALCLMLFAGFSSAGVNPLYRGTAVITNTPLSQEIRKLSAHDAGRWAAENTLMENFTALNGARSLSGVYNYPQLDLWRPIDAGAHQNDYNRYAHVSFDFDRDPLTITPTSIKLIGGDSFRIETEPCSSFMKDKGVHFLLAISPLSEQDGCAQLVDRISYPATTFYIYRIFP